MYEEVNVAERIKKICKLKGIPVSNLEKEMGWGNGSIGRWNKVKPSIEKIFAVADRLGVTLDELFETCSDKERKEPMGEHVDKKILEITKKKLLNWRFMEKEEWKEYEKLTQMYEKRKQQHAEIYVSRMGSGYIFLLICYEEDEEFIEELEMHLFLSSEEGEPEEEKSEKKTLHKLLKYVEPALYDKWNHSGLESFRQELMNL